MSKILGRIVDFHHLNMCERSGCPGHRVQCVQNNTSDTVSFTLDDVEFSLVLDEQEWLAMVRSWQLLGQTPVANPNPVHVGTTLSRIVDDLAEFDLNDPHPSIGSPEFRKLLMELRVCAKRLMSAEWESVVRLKSSKTDEIGWCMVGGHPPGCRGSEHAKLMHLKDLQAKLRLKDTSSAPAAVSELAEVQEDIVS